MARREISSIFAEEMLECVRHHGIEPTDDMLELAAPIAGTNKVATDGLGKLWLASATAMNDEFLGMSERPMPSGSFALLGHCVLHAGTLKRALSRTLDFLRIVLGRPSGTLAVKDGIARISLTEPGTNAQAFAHRMYWILVHGLSCWLVGRRIPLRQVDFGCDMPASEADYRLFFGARVRFSQAESALTFDARYLDLPIRRTEGALQQFLRNAPGNILVRYRQDEDFASRIRTRLDQQSPVDWPLFEALARQMGLSTASLRRRLSAEGQSFQKIKDSIRRRLAMEWLTSEDHNVAEISVRLGFGEASAFHRAFRKWTGLTPGSYRRMAPGSTTIAR